MLSGLLFMAAGSGSGLGLTSTALSVRRANFSGVTGLPFPLAYTTAVGSSGKENVWLAGNGRRPTRVGPTMEFPPPLEWSANGRYLVTVVDAYSYSSSVERYDDVTGDIQTWSCGGCVGAVVVGNGIVAVSSKLQLLLFPLGGGRVEPPRSITGMPQWSRSSLPHSIPVAVGGTRSAVLLAWPIADGASNVWGTYVLVALDGRYLRAVVGPGKSKQGVSLADDPDGVEMAPSTAQRAGERVVRDFGVRRRRQPHTAFPHHAWEHHLSESAGSDGHRCRPDQLRDRLGREHLGGVHFDEMVLPAGDLR